MVDAVNHDLASSASTAGMETVKGAAKWAAAIPLAVGVVAAVSALAFHGALLTAVVAGVAATAVTGLGAITVGLPVTGALAAIGGALGLIGSGNKINQEKQAYLEKTGNLTEKRAQKKAEEFNNAQLVGMQEGYAQGFKEGQTKIINDLRQLQYQIIQQQMGKAANIDQPPLAQTIDKTAPNFAANFQKSDSKAQAVTEGRETVAAANQVG